MPCRIPSPSRSITTALNDSALPSSPRDAVQTATAVPASCSCPAPSTPAAPQPISDPGDSSDVIAATVRSSDIRCAPLANTTARSAASPPRPDAASRPAVAAARVGSVSVQTAVATFMRSRPATSLDDTAPMGGADVIALFGPTGVGKTEVAIALAARLRELGERPVAISADALQVY